MDINTLNVTELRALVKQANKRIDEILPFEKAATLKVGSTIILEKNHRVKALLPRTAYDWERWLHYKFIGTDPKRDSHMLVYGPIDEDGSALRTVSVSKSLLRRVVKKA